MTCPLSFCVPLQTDWRLIEMKRLISVILLILPGLLAHAQWDGSTRTPGDTIVSPVYHLSDSTLYYPPVSSYYFWNGSPLHSGLNAQLSMSATVGLGGHHPGGVGFGKDINIVYASPIKGKMGYTLGLNHNSLNWGGLRWNEASIGGSLNYNPSDRVYLSIEGYKNLMRSDSRVNPLYRPWDYDSYLGGSLGIKFSPYIFVQVSVGTSTWR